MLLYISNAYLIIRPLLHFTYAEYSLTAFFSSFPVQLSLLQTPHLVAGMSRTIIAGRAVLVGGAAWLSYAPNAVITEDMDFVVPRASLEDLRIAAHDLIQQAARVPAVCTALAILDAISSAHRSTFGISSQPDEHAARIKAAEQVLYDPARDYSSFFQVLLTAFDHQHSKFALPR